MATAIKKALMRFPAMVKVSFLVFWILKRAIIPAEVALLNPIQSAKKTAKQQPIDILMILSQSTFFMPSSPILVLILLLRSWFNHEKKDRLIFTSIQPVSLFIKNRYFEACQRAIEWFAFSLTFLSIKKQLGNKRLKISSFSINIIIRNFRGLLSTSFYQYKKHSRNTV